MKKTRNSIIAGSTFAILAVAFTGHFEGKRNYVYLDPIGVKTWCNGETNDTLGKKIVVGKTYFTEDECSQLLMKSLQKHNAPLEQLDYDLTVGQHYAFLDGIYNFGETNFRKFTIGKLVFAGKPNEACDQFERIRFAGKRDCKIKSNNCYGIWERRQAERDVCKGTITVQEFLLRVNALPKGGDYETGE